MGYYMRFLVTEDREIDLDMIEEAYRKLERAYHISNRADKMEEGLLFWNDELLGEVEINRRETDGMLEEEINMFHEFLDEIKGSGRDKVLQVLDQCRCLVVFQVFWQDREAEKTLSMIEPLWFWLFENYSGVLQADADGFYDETGQILDTTGEVELLGPNEIETG